MTDRHTPYLSLFFVLISLLPLPLSVTVASAQSKISPQADSATTLASWGVASIDAINAWRLSEDNKAQDKREIRVAVIDTGADVSHPGIKHNLWTNEGESGFDAAGRDKSNNGVDDDRNGFIDDVHGWNFVQDSNDVSDRHGHGTHIAGIIESVAPRVSLIIIKYYDPGTTGNKALSGTIQAIRYAIKMKAQIINYSGGGSAPSLAEEAAIREAHAKGILFVAAAGNQHMNSDVHRYYPADYGLSNILSVTAIDISKHVLSTSNYGERTVHIGAPGSDIYSTLPGGGYGFMTGTSQATAFASGAAALLYAQSSDLRRPEQIIDQLVNSGIHTLALNGKTKARTVLNSYRALAMQDRGTAVTGVTAANSAGIDLKLFTQDH